MPRNGRKGAALPNDLLAVAALLWIAGGIVALIGRPLGLVRIMLGLGGLAAICAAVISLPSGTASVAVPVLRMAGETTSFEMPPEALWLMGFGLVPAVLACLLATPSRPGRAAWLFGAACSLLGALGVFGLGNGGFFLVAWELMSLGGAVMILGDRLAPAPGAPVLFMLGMLEVGTIALLVAYLVLALPAQGLSFEAFASAGPTLSVPVQIVVGILLVIGFGAKLGLLPFYEWFPGAYASGSGASGALLSGVVLNAAFFGLERGLIDWLPASGGAWLFSLGLIVTLVGVLSAVLAALYAFQQDDWRRLLAFSSAENASIAVATLGAGLLFRHDGQGALAGLAWTVALLQLSGHALAKGGLFLCADAVHGACGSYQIRQRGWLKQAGLVFGIGALFATMSLAAMPPQIGFATEWFVFQTVFQGFHLSSLGGRIILTLAGAGLALTAAVALATFVKLLGVGLLGAPGTGAPIGRRYAWSSLLLGLAVLGAAVGLPLWLRALGPAALARFGSDAPDAMSHAWLLVPLTNTFAFISPSKLAIALPLLSIVPLLLLALGRGPAPRRTRVWYGGLREPPQHAATTSLTFANATRTFYSFIYRPTLDTAREHASVAYFVRKLEFDHAVADFFGPILFTPLRAFIWRWAGRLRALQSGDLNFYLGLIGVLLLIILALTLR